MKKMNSDLLFLCIAAIYYTTRIPDGDTLQHVADACVFVTVLFIFGKNIYRFWQRR